VERLREERTLYDALMARALRLASTSLEDMGSEPSVFVQGASMLLDEVGSDDPDGTIETLRTLLLMIEEKARLLRLLDDCLGGGDLTVVIGSEHSSAEFRRFSIVVSTYSDGRGTGAVGVIGPTRMHYSRAINAVDSLARIVGRVVATRS
jgi:heat-inducible transcriptional repressor